jgi:hypothetical protein
MKSLRKIRLSENMIELSDIEMKMTTGGSGGSGGTGDSGSGTGTGTGTCGWIKVVDGITWYECGVSKEEALRKVADGGRWCCDSCLSTDYCDWYFTK